MSKGFAFLAGGLIGAAIALLYAPRSGAETRAMVSEKMGEAWGGAQEFGSQVSENAQRFYQDAAARGQVAYQNAAAKGQEFYQAAVVKGQEVVEAASARMQEAESTLKPMFAEKNDELRAKIEAARQRIASQVARNAEEDQGLASGEIPVQAEAEGQTTY